jgi:hypothetical protein
MVVIEDFRFTFIRWLDIGRVHPLMIAYPPLVWATLFSACIPSVERVRVVAAFHCSEEEIFCSLKKHNSIKFLSYSLNDPGLCNELNAKAAWMDCAGLSGCLNESHSLAVFMTTLAGYRC